MTESQNISELEGTNKDRRVQLLSDPYWVPLIPYWDQTHNLGVITPNSTKICELSSPVSDILVVQDLDSSPLESGHQFRYAGQKEKEYGQDGQWSEVVPYLLPY
ncbi:hypothetical protein BTVI_31262 [Pitangus sulphuratus]|nr:hypothetical protein BTVI_31262 [Pitangus sulphuratus]